MKFLVDAQLPPALCRWLEAHGHDATHVFEIGLGGATDVVISELAAHNCAILLTKDEDFQTLRLPDRFAMLWLRCGNSTNAALAVWLEVRWNRIETLLASGERMIEVR